MGVTACVCVGVVISCTNYSPGVATPPDGKELGENEEASSNNSTRFSPNLDSDYHSLSNAPILSPGTIYCVGKYWRVKTLPNGLI